MFLSKRPNGYYYLYYDHEGKRKTISTAKKVKSEALKFLKEFDPATLHPGPPSHHPTLSAFIQEFIEYSKTIHTNKTQRGVQSAFREFMKVLGDVDLSAIGPRQIDAFLSIKRSEASEWTARKYSITLSAAFETAKRWSYITTNPFRQIKRLRMPEIQPVFFTKEDFRTLLAAIEDLNYRDYVAFAVQTGMRLNEISSLTWDDIDLKNRLIHVRNKIGFTTKSKRNRTIPMNDSLVEMLEMKKDKPHGSHVFEYAGKPYLEITITKKFKNLVRRLKLDDRLHFHSLRHTFASWLVQEGVPIQYVKELLGHADIKTTMIYAHLQPSLMHSSVNKISIPNSPK